MSKKEADRPASAEPRVTELLAAWSNGDESALNTMMPLVYDELHRMARRFMARQKAGHTLQPTALINEAFIKLVGNENKEWKDRAHFFGVAAQAMRHILVDYARSRSYAKRGGGAQRVDLDQALAVTQERTGDIVALDDALNELTKVDARKSQVVELRYFGGLTVDETAEVLKVSSVTVMRDWSLAKAWLYRELAKTK
jgi:RNA polymerase sigma factor (TIGR02999 family)